MTQPEIHSVAIYPGIGIARVGNSEEYFLAPEVPGAIPDAGGSFKDPDKKVKRQAGIDSGPERHESHDGRRSRCVGGSFPKDRWGVPEGSKKRSRWVESRSRSVDA